VLCPGEEIEAHFVGQDEIPLALGIGVDEGGDTSGSPVLGGGVGVENAGPMGHARVLEEAFA